MAILNQDGELYCGRRQWLICRSATLAVILVLGHCFAADQPLDEYQVKAAFLYNFAKFVQWPPEVFARSNQPISICVLGQDPFGSSLEDTVAGRVIEGRSLVVHHISNVNLAAGCHVLFISSTENTRALSSLAEIKTRGILTVGESDVSGADGIIINFKLERGKVRFEINVGAAEQQNLRISSRLLTLAHIVGTGQK